MATSLLYRRDISIDHADGDDTHMSADVIANALLGVGIRNISGGRLVFVNFSRGQLLDRSWELFDPESVVIELLERVECNCETLSACREMTSAGYKLALDDFVADERMHPLVELASIVKIDVLNRPVADLRGVADQLRSSGVRLLAERVEKASVRDVCTDLGYELFQGYLFSRPETLTKSDVSASHLAVIQLLNLLQNPDTPTALWTPRSRVTSHSVTSCFASSTRRRSVGAASSRSRTPCVWLAGRCSTAGLRFFWSRRSEETVT
jgi:EAL and modified HD-GYP domain-containing signal transduction protein